MKAGSTRASAAPGFAVHGHSPKKRFGQHFLTDPAVIAEIIAAIDPRPGQRIVEIGPGDGALTRPLLHSAGGLTAIELDRDLIPRLAALGPGLDIVQADVLDVDFHALAGSSRIRLVGNLPYNVSSPILFHCLDALDVIEDMHFMLQREVVERMVAAPGNKTYGRLSVMVQLACVAESLIGVPPRAFSPPPKVQSAVVRLLPRRDGPDFPRDAVARVVRAAFGQRRKKLSNALSGLLDAEAIRAAGVDPGLRAERLPPEAFVALARVAAPD